MLSPPSSTSSGGNSVGLFNPNLAYMSRIVQGLVDMFEKYFSGDGCLTRSCAKIFDILSGYLETFYTTSGRFKICFKISGPVVLKLLQAQ